MSYIGNCDDCGEQVFDGDRGYYNSVLSMLKCIACVPTYSQITDRMQICGSNVYGANSDRFYEELKCLSSQKPDHKFVHYVIKEKRTYDGWVLSHPKYRWADWIPNDREYKDSCVTCGRYVFVGDRGYYDDVPMEYYCIEHAPTIIEQRSRIEGYVHDSISSKGYLTMFDIHHEGKPKDERLVKIID